MYPVLPFLVFFFQEPKKNPKAKESHEEYQRVFGKDFSEQVEGVTGHYPLNPRVLRQIAPESSPESSAKSLS